MKKMFLCPKCKVWNPDAWCGGCGIEIMTLRQKFIREFCNDHNEKVRWLRSIAFDMPELLDKILEFLDRMEKES